MDWREETTSSALILLEIPDPSVAFLVNGMGSALCGGHCGKAVDTLRPPADLGFSRLVELFEASDGRERGVETVRPPSRRRCVLTLEMTGVTGFRATTTGLASCTVAFCSSSIRESLSDISKYSALDVIINGAGFNRSFCSFLTVDEDVIVVGPPSEIWGFSSDGDASADASSIWG